MDDDHWLALLARLGPQSPVDLDGQAAAGPVLPARGPAAYWPPSARLWDRPEDGAVAIGLRVAQGSGPDPALAARLAGAALERGLLPVLLCRGGTRGYDRLGLRTEAVFGETEEEIMACEAELSRFWGFAMIVEARDVVGAA